MDESKFIELQQQMKQNQADLGSYLADLDSWTNDIKKKEASLKEQKPNGNTELPPVRNSLEKKRRKKKKKTKTAETDVKPKSQKIKSSDYRSWDKFDVDKALKDIDGEDDAKPESDELETDEEWENERKKRQADLFKSQGNQYFKEEKYTEAVECYTQGIDCDPENAVLPANRAMALIKQEKYAAAELDCSRALHLDPCYVKAYHRRGTARAALMKYKDAKDDFLALLALDSNNKQAKAELSKVEKILNPPEILKSLSVEASSSAVVKPIYKPPNQRSKKPLRRIQVEEIGIEEQEIKIPQASETKQKLEGKEKATFDEQFLRKETTPAKHTEDPVTNNLHNKITEITNKFTSTSINNSDKDDSMKLDLSQMETKESKKTSPRSDSPQTSPRIPPIPASSSKFQADVRALKNRPEDFYQYLKVIPHQRFSNIFGGALDLVFDMVLNTLQEYYVPRGENVFSVLEGLTTAKSDFNIVVMLMSKEQKKVVRDLLSYAKDQKQASEDKISALAKKYSV